MTAGGRSTIDYKEAERRYVVEGKSVRAIAREMGLSSWSSMNTIANREDWKGKRSAYMSAIARRSYETAAATVASEQNIIRDETVLAGRATIRAYIQGITDGSIKPNARDAQVWAAWLLEAAKEVTGPSTEEPNVTNVTPPDADVLRRVVEAARRQVAPTGGVGPALVVVPPSTRSN